MLTFLPIWNWNEKIIDFPPNLAYPNYFYYIFITRISSKFPIDFFHEFILNFNIQERTCSYRNSISWPRVQCCPLRRCLLEVKSVMDRRIVIPTSNLMTTIVWSWPNSKTKKVLRGSLLFIPDYMSLGLNAWNLLIMQLIQEILWPKVRFNVGSKSYL